MRDGAEARSSAATNVGKASCRAVAQWTSALLGTRIGLLHVAVYDTLASVNVAAGWSKDHGEALRQRRLELGLRQRDIADLVRQPRTVVSNWESGTRRPSTVSPDKLAEALQWSVEQMETLLSDGPSLVTPSSLKKRWDGMWPAVDGLIAPRYIGRLERFTRQVDMFALLAEAEFAQARWQQLFTAATPTRDVLRDTSHQGAGTKTIWRDAGTQLARQVRTVLQLGTAPLKSPSVIGELCGLRVFQVALPAGERGQLQGLVCPVDGIGVATLINAELDARTRLLTLSRLLGSALLRGAASLVTRPSGAGDDSTAKSSGAAPVDPSNTKTTAPSPAAGESHRSRRRGRPLDATISAFADEFVLPHAALETYATTIRQMSARARNLSTASLEAQAVAEMVETYGARPRSTNSRLLRALGRPHSGQSSSERHDVQLITALADRPGPNVSGDAQRTLGRTVEPHLEDLPRGFVDLLITEIVANRATVDGVAELTGVAPDEVRERLMPPHDGTDDVREQEFSVA